MPWLPSIWHEQYPWSRAPEVRAIARSRTFDLTLLTAADIPWVRDGDRNSDAVRQWMRRPFEQELRLRPEPVVELRGTVEQRLATAVDTIDRHLGLRPSAAVTLNTGVLP